MLLSDHSLELKINGNQIDCNTFVIRAFSKTILGLISSLDGLPIDPELVEIKISTRD